MSASSGSSASAAAVKATAAASLPVAAAATAGTAARAGATLPHRHASGPAAAALSGPRARSHLDLALAKRGSALLQARATWAFKPSLQANQAFLQHTATLGRESNWLFTQEELTKKIEELESKGDTKKASYYRTFTPVRGREKLGGAARSGKQDPFTNFINEDGVNKGMLLGPPEFSQDSTVILQSLTSCPLRILFSGKRHSVLCPELQDFHWQ